MDRVAAIRSGLGRLFKLAGSLRNFQSLARAVRSSAFPPMRGRPISGDPLIPEDSDQGAEGSDRNKLTDRNR